MRPLLWIFLASLSAPAAPSAAPLVPCKTVADCWLDADGHAIPRPKRYRGRPLPRGDCGKNELWLSNKLSCEDAVCVARYISNKC